MAKLADASDLKSEGAKAPSGFDSQSGHQHSLLQSWGSDKRRFSRVLLIAATIEFAACSRTPPAGHQPNPHDQIVAGTTTRSGSLPQLEHAERRPIGVVSPQQLYDAFTRNQFSAESNYEGQFVKVVGPLVGMRQDNSDVAVLRLGLGPTYAPGASIDARFDPEDEGPLKDLVVGQVVSVIGSPQHDATDGLVLLRCMVAPTE